MFSRVVNRDRRFCTIRESKIRMRNRLRILRAERKWSQQRLADELNVSRQTINAIENGKYDPSLTLAIKMSRLFNLTVEDIFEPQESDLL